MESDPPFQNSYKTLFEEEAIKERESPGKNPHKELDIVVECDLPLIDLSRLSAGDEFDREECKKETAKASQEWGFFQVVNHGISCMTLERMRCEQVEIFRRPFYQKKSNDSTNLSTGSYQWGSPTAKSLKHLSWMEVFHLELSDILGSDDSLSSAIQQFATVVTDLGQKLIGILAEKRGHDSIFFKKHCSTNTCFVRLNRYPPCPIYSELVDGVIPHTDGSVLTILHQDCIGGLQMVKGGKWFTVKPDPQALVIIIGDLLQAWSNGVYKSVKHRVVANQQKERFSIAYFVCPSNDTVIRSCSRPLIYREFSVAEYKKQTAEDLKNHGNKTGLSRFLVENNST